MNALHIIKSLKTFLRDDQILFLPSQMEDFSSDGTKLKFYPDIVVFPSNAIDVSNVLSFANNLRIPVVPRGAGTGMSGGALPVKGGILLAMDKMNKIINIDKDNMICRVEPGVITGDLQNEVKKMGLFYPPYPASANISTIGGNVAECAGGLRAVKYGVTRDYVLGLTLVLPTGEILNTGTNTVKGVVGYDLTRLIVGSEGTLAVITEIILRLIPEPESRKSLVVFFERIEDAISVVINIGQAKIIPSILEFLDDICLDCIKEDLYIPPSTNSMLIIELDGPKVLVNEEVIKVQHICYAQNGVNVYIPKDLNEETKIWDVRNNLSHSLYKLRPNKISEDIVVPRSNIPTMIAYLRLLSEEYNLPIPVFGHAGDGNLHVNIMLDKNIKEEVKKIGELIPKIFSKVVELGGTISGEHGIGITKASYIDIEISDVGINIMKRIKQVFDPNNILNPDKIFCRGDFYDRIVGGQER